MIEYRGSFDRNGLLHIQWHLGNYCNYRCSYCNDGLRDGSKPFIDIEIAKRFVSSITRQAEERYRQVEFTLSGGEPTVYGELPQLLEHINSCGAFSHIITNGSRSEAYYRRIAPLLTHGLIFTFHSETANLTKFIENLKVFDPRWLMVYIPMNPKLEEWNKCVEAYRTMQTFGWRVIPKTVFEDFGFGGGNNIVAYSKVQREFIAVEATAALEPRREVKATWEFITPSKTEYRFRRPGPVLGHRVIQIIRGDPPRETHTTPQSLIVNKANDFRGLKCNAGIEFLLIGFGGAVVRANCQQNSDIIADISRNPEFKLPENPIVCNVPLCWCEGDLLIKKFS